MYDIVNSFFFTKKVKFCDVLTDVFVYEDQHIFLRFAPVAYPWKILFAKLTLNPEIGQVMFSCRFLHIIKVMKAQYS